MSFEKACELLREFDYIKNGKEHTVRFLAFMLDMLLNGDDRNE